MTPESNPPRNFFQRLGDLIASAPWRAAGLSAGLLLAIGLILTFAAVEVTSRPSFCGSCHIMVPYYQSWRHSTHKNVACVECHIAPGVGAEIRKKFEALSMVAKYFTATYGTNPWTEIDDAACLRCHQRRLLEGKAMLRDILFDHTAHLSEMRRGKTLRCTSCHSQIVQGSHIAVTTSTCILCHFKGTPEGTGTTRCLLCHTIPQKTFALGTVSFNHSDVARFGMECRWCHARPAESDGAVPKERCITCHNQTSRLEKYADTELLHRKHVTEHKVNCLFCHLEIQHVSPIDANAAKSALARAQIMNTRIHEAASDCRSCHEASHSPQLVLYSGTGGRGLAPMPSPMFQAGVRCEGCHMVLPGHESDVSQRASDVACMACHGPGYEKIYQNWISGSVARTTAVARQLDETAAAIGGAGSSTKLADARFNLTIVSQGHAVHNPPYAYALLRAAHDQMNAARKDHGLAPLPSPWPEVPYSSPCLQCHEGIESQRGSIFDNKPFPHENHVIAAKLNCAVCHRTHAERAKGEIVRFDQTGCISCHHKPPVQDCATCHADVKQHTVKSFRGDFDHKMHIEDADKTCVDCHDVTATPPLLKKQACTECHEDK